MDLEYEFIALLKDPNTTVEVVQKVYARYPRLSGHMVEDIQRRRDLLDFFASVDWFRQAGRAVYDQICNDTQ